MFTYRGFRRHLVDDVYIYCRDAKAAVFDVVVVRSICFASTALLRGVRR